MSTSTETATREEPTGEEKKEANDAIPVTILSGFLGSGKTTLLRNILQSSDHGLKVAVIVNDMAELNIDSATIQQPHDGAIVQTQREVVSLQNGCICCTLRGDLIREISRIKATEDFDYVVIESTGIAEPQQVAQAFVFDPATQQLAEKEQDMLWTQARLDTCVTVIDAHSFATQLTSLEQFGDSYEDGLDRSTPEGVEEGTKSIATLLMEQIEFANILLLNKTDLVTDEDITRTKLVLKKLNPSAELLSTEFCKVDLHKIVNTGVFDMAKAVRSPGWLEAIREIREKNGGSASAAQGEVDEYGVTSFVYRARVPFHPNRIAKWVDSILHFANEWKALTKEQRQASSDKKHEHMLSEYGTILRAKGFCWLAYHDSFMLGFAQSGRIGSIHPIMPWYTVIPPDQWGVEIGSPDYHVIHSKFQKPHGDRRQELVFIGTDLKRGNIEAALNKCLLTKKELENYKFYSDQSSLSKKS